LTHPDTSSQSTASASLCTGDRDMSTSSNQKARSPLLPNDMRLSLLHSTSLVSGRGGKRRSNQQIARVPREKENEVVVLSPTDTDTPNLHTEQSHKIRVVEKSSSSYSSGANTICNHDIIRASSPTPTVTSTSTSASNTTPFTMYHEDYIQNENIINDSEEWLEDSALSMLRPADLSSIMDHVLLTVVKQLIQFASSDIELKAELDSLDETGFSLLHYCSMFNLEHLVPVILSKGGGVNHKTRCGSTALHLAASAGHIAVTRLLVESGADIEELDASGLRPEDQAIRRGFIEVVSYLREVGHERGNGEGHTLSSRPSSIDLNQSNGVDDTYHQSASNTPPSSRMDMSTNDFTSYGSNQNTSPCTSEHFSHEITNNIPHNYSHTESKTASPSVSVTSDLDLRQNSLLYDAFASLSLADKCAFSLSLGGNSSSNIDIEGNKTLRVTMSGDVSDDNDFDVQSVLSETDKESLDVAMSMMTESELGKVEAEVRVIQNNVRTWLLRKNYTNLREAARVLQAHWRQRRTPQIGLGVTGRGSSMSIRPTAVTRALEGDGDGDGDYDGHVNGIKQTTAAATLQAATRGMLARKSFASLKRQAVASLVIQKSLMNWWQQKAGVGGVPVGEPPARLPNFLEAMITDVNMNINNKTTCEVNTKLNTNINNSSIGMIYDNVKSGEDRLDRNKDDNESEMIMDI